MLNKPHVSQSWLTKVIKKEQAYPDYKHFLLTKNINSKIAGCVKQSLATCIFKSNLLNVLLYREKRITNLKMCPL